MPIDKDFKKLVRSRMAKTGEAYTAARAHLLTKPAAVNTAPPPPDYAALAGMTDAAIARGTGRRWREWVETLDRAGAAEWPHRRIAEHLRAEYEIGDWWSQTVTVGYERIKGLRAIGQRRGGSFEATKSKTVNAPAGKVHRAIADARLRQEWLPDATPTLRSAAAGKSVRFTWDDSTSVEFGLTRKAGGRTSVAVTHKKLATKADADRWKVYWQERLVALAASLTTE